MNDHESNASPNPPSYSNLPPDSIMPSAPFYQPNVPSIPRNDPPNYPNNQFAYSHLAQAQRPNVYPAVSSRDYQSINLPQNQINHQNQYPSNQFYQLPNNFAHSNPLPYCYNNNPHRGQNVPYSGQSVPYHGYQPQPEIIYLPIPSSSHHHLHHEHRSNDSSSCGCLQGCLAALCCCCILESLFY